MYNIPHIEKKSFFFKVYSKPHIDKRLRVVTLGFIMKLPRNQQLSVVFCLSNYCFIRSEFRNITNLFNTFLASLVTHLLLSIFWCRDMFYDYDAENKSSSTPLLNRICQMLEIAETAKSYSWPRILRRGGI